MPYCYVEQIKNANCKVRFKIGISVTKFQDTRVQLLKKRLALTQD